MAKKLDIREIIELVIAVVVISIIYIATEAFLVGPAKFLGFILPTVLALAIILKIFKST